MSTVDLREERAEVRAATGPPLEECWISVRRAIEITKAFAGPTASTGYAIGTLLQAMRSGVVGFAGTRKKRRWDADFWQNAILEDVFDDQGKLVDVRVVHQFPEPDTADNVGSSFRRVHTTALIGTLISRDDLSYWLNRHLRPDWSSEIQSRSPDIVASIETTSVDARAFSGKRKPGKATERKDQNFETAIKLIKEEGYRPRGQYANIKSKDWIFTLQLKLRPDLEQEYQHKRCNAQLETGALPAGFPSKSTWIKRRLLNVPNLNAETLRKIVPALEKNNNEVRALLQTPGRFLDL